MTPPALGSDRPESGSGGGRADQQGQHGSVGAWISVIVMIAAFIVGALALILLKVWLGIAAGVLLVAGAIGALASGIMEDVR